MHISLCSLCNSHLNPSCPSLFVTLGDLHDWAPWPWRMGCFQRTPLMQGCWVCPSLEGEAYRCHFRVASGPGSPVEWQDPGETQQKIEVYATAPSQYMSICHLQLHAALLTSLDTSTTRSSLFSPSLSCKIIGKFVTLTNLFFFPVGPASLTTGGPQGYFDIFWIMLIRLLAENCHRFQLKIVSHITTHKKTPYNVLNSELQRCFFNQPLVVASHVMYRHDSGMDLLTLLSARKWISQ